jgi:hypothetical protein
MNKKIASWNIRGAHSNLKLDQVKCIISEFNICLFGLLETKLNHSLSQKASSYINPQWSFHHNLESASYGRILVIYDSSFLTLTPILSTRQFIHFHVHVSQNQSTFYLTFVYADNSVNSRNALLNALPPLRQSSHPWIVLGDFNCCFGIDDKFGGTPLNLRDIEPLNQSVYDSELTLVNKTGTKYSWNNCSRSGVRTFTTIDHAFCNYQALNQWPSLSIYLPQPIMSDHSPQILTLGTHIRREKSSFKFFNAWSKHDQFLNIINQAISDFTCYGNPMYKFCRKLKHIKIAIKTWASTTFGTGTLLSTALKEQLKIKQDFMMEHPLNIQASDEERNLHKELKIALTLEASMKMQQLHKRWLDEGDKNTKYFHESLKVKQARENIFRITNEQGTLFSTPDTVDHAFIQHFTNLYGSTNGFFPDLDKISSLDLPSISPQEASSLIMPVTNEEIKATLFSMNKLSCSGPDGLNVNFFITTWSLIGGDFCQAIHNFFNKCKMLGEVNCTNIALIPKVSPPTCVTSFRPISCCNVLYKCISKILASRLVKVLPTVISMNQSAFLPSRDIIDNVLLAQELLKGYGRSNNTPAAAIKIDISKAYDTIHWDSIVRIMAVMGFPKTFVSWIYVCISTPSFSIVLNGRPVGYFRGSKGIRQGDPISSYLFLMVMEVLTVILQASYNQKTIKYHPKCSLQQITSIMFADDVMVFTKPETSSLDGIKTALQAFHCMTGLTINQFKSSLLVTGVSDLQATALQQHSGLSCMVNDMKYLGLPLISKRISKADCLPLYFKISSVMSAWNNRHLSQSGRLVLIKSVVFSSIVYWARTLILPKKLLHMLRSAMIRYFWTGSIHNRKLVPCSFSKIESPLRLGGLGVFDVRIWNIAAMSKHFNALINKRCSLWVDWSWQYNIKNKYFWSMDIPQVCSWTWRSLLNLRVVFLPMIQYPINASNVVSFWHDPWISNGQILSNICDQYQMIQSAIHYHAKVKDFLHYNQIQLPYNSNQVIRQLWREIQQKTFSTNQDDTVTWLNKIHTVAAVYTYVSSSVSLPASKWIAVLWSADSCPKDNLMMWKVINQALVTRCLLNSYGMTCYAECIFCNQDVETTEHLFFACPALQYLMDKISIITGFNFTCSTSRIQWSLIYKATKWRNVQGRVLAVCLKVCMSVIWRERNAIIFDKVKRTDDLVWVEVRNRTNWQLQNSASVFHQTLIDAWT